MAAGPVLRVILSAVDDVTGNAKKASKGLSDFVGGAMSAIKGLVALAAASALAGFFKSALEEADNARLGMLRMGQAVTNVGGDFSKLKQPLEEAVRSVMKLSTATDDDLRAALTTMITVSGDAKGSIANLGLVADLAAFKHISLEEASTLVGKAMAGNTKGLRAYGISIKDGADAIDALRVKVGGFSQNEAQTFSGGITQIKNQFGEFKEAIGEVILSNGALGEATGVVAGALGKLALWVEQNEEKLGFLVKGVQTFLVALWDVARMIYDALAPALGPLLGALFKELLVWVGQAGAGVRLLGGFFLGTAAIALDAIGAIVEAGGKLLKVFGIEVVEGYGKTLRAAADKLKAAADRQIALGLEASKKGFADLAAAKAGHNKKVESEEVAHQGRLTGIASSGLKDREDEERKALIARNKINEETMKLLTHAQTLLLKATKDNRDEWIKSKAALNEYHTLLRDQVLVASQNISAEIEKNKAALETINEAEAKRRAALESMVSSARQVADGIIDGAQASGVMSDEMADVMQSMMNIAQSVARFGIDPLGGMIGVLGGLANLIGGWASNPAEKARMEMTKRNIEALQKNTSALSTTATGRTVSATETALKAAQAAAKKDTGMQTGGGPDIALRARAAREAFAQSLFAQGVSRADALALMKDLDIGGLDSGDAKTFLASLGFAQTQLGRFQLGKAGTDFASQKKLLEEQFEVFGVSGAGDKLGAFAKLGRFSPALAAALASGDLRTVKGNLQALFTQITSGGFKGREGELGDIGGPALIDFIKQLLGLIAEMGDNTSMTEWLTGAVSGADASRALIPDLGLVPSADLPELLTGESRGTRRSALTAAGTYVTVNIGTIEQHLASSDNPEQDARALVAEMIDEIDREFEERIQRAALSLGKAFTS